MWTASTASWIDQPSRSLNSLLPASTPPAAADRIASRVSSESADRRIRIWHDEQTPSLNLLRLSAYSTWYVTRSLQIRQRNSRYFALQVGQSKLPSAVRSADFP